MQSQQPNPFFTLFQKRRLKVAELNRARREEIFNRSRKILSDQLDNLSLGPSNSQSSNLKEGTTNFQQDQSSSLNAHKEIDAIFNMGIQQNQVTNFPHLTANEDNTTLDEKPLLSNQDRRNSRNKNNKIRKHAKNYVKILQTPSWMNTVPQELNKFYVAARANGKSGLLVIEDGWVYIYDKYGRQININKFSQTNNQNQSILKKLSLHYEGTILDITYCEDTHTIFVNDLIKWKQTIMVAENFQFRYAWLVANIGQLVNCKFYQMQIRLMQYLPLDNSDNLRKIYVENLGYEKQGLLFVQKDSPYMHGYNQNVMIWKDYHTSKYSIDQQTLKTQTGKQDSSMYIYGMGKLSRSGNIYSLDGCKLGHIDPAAMSGVDRGFIRYRISGIEFNNQTKDKHMMDIERQGNMDVENEFKLQLVNFEVIQYKRYARAQPLSRLIFQHRMKHDPLSIEKIAASLPIQ